MHPGSSQAGTRDSGASAKIRISAAAVASDTTSGKDAEPDTASSVGQPGADSNTKGLPAKIEGINFTKLDTGFSGHSIPFKLIASMLDRGAPQDGYKLVPAQLGGGSRLARFFSRKIEEGQATQTGIWQNVVKVDR
jgi:hypothetical protein